MLVDGEPWFVAADVCSVLGIGNTSQAVSYLDVDERQAALISSEGGERSLNVVNEPGLYSLVLRSRKPEAKAFKRWITHEVLPEIRRTGRYEAPMDELELAERYVASIKARRELEMRNAELTPKAEAFDAFMEADGTYSMGAVANLLGVGRTTLFRWLRDEAILQRDNRPYQRYAHHFKVVAQSYEARGERRPTYTTYVRPSGVEFLRRRRPPGTQLTLVS